MSSSRLSRSSVGRSGNETLVDDGNAEGRVDDAAMVDCPECAEQIQWIDLKGHYAAYHLDYFPYKCRCQRWFASEHQLKQHVADVKHFPMHLRCYYVIDKERRLREVLSAVVDTITVDRPTTENGGDERLFGDLSFQIQSTDGSNCSGMTMPSLSGIECNEVVDTNSAKSSDGGDLVNTDEQKIRVTAHPSTSRKRPFPVSEFDDGISAWQDDEESVNCIENNNSHQIFTEEQLYRTDAETPDKPVFLCNFCDYSTHYRSHIRGHSRIHTGEKPYKCELCGREFRHPHHLKGHQNRAHAYTKEKGTPQQRDGAITTGIPPTTDID